MARDRSTDNSVENHGKIITTVMGELLRTYITISYPN